MLDDLIQRGLRRPAYLVVDGAPGLEAAIAAVWDGRAAGLSNTNAKGGGTRYSCGRTCVIEILLRSQALIGS